MIVNVEISLGFKNNPVVMALFVHGKAPLSVPCNHGAVVLDRISFGFVSPLCNSPTPFLRRWLLS
jgi:hypothetical protein